MASTAPGTTGLTDLVQVLDQTLNDHDTPNGRGGAVMWKWGPGMVATTLMLMARGQCVTHRWREEQAGLYWPSKLDQVQILFMGEADSDPGPDQGGWLRLGPLYEHGLALRTSQYIVWRRGAPTWGEWNGRGPAKLVVLEPDRVRGPDFLQAWRDLELVGKVVANRGRAGRPIERTAWPRTRFVQELEAYCAQSKGALTQVEAAKALDDTPIDTFRERFRRYVTRVTGQNWAAFTANYSPHISL